MSPLRRLAMLVTVLVTALFATTSIAAPASQAETRVWAFLFASGECVGADALEVRGTHQGNGLAGYDFASGDTVAARGAPRRTAGVNPHPTDPNVSGGATNHRGRYQAGRDAAGEARLPGDWAVHHTTPQRLGRDGHSLATGIDIHHPTRLRGVPGSKTRRAGVPEDGPGGAHLDVLESSGRRRTTNVHGEIDHELTQFLETNPTRAQLDEFIAYQDWRWGHTFWEGK